VHQALSIRADPSWILGVGDVVCLIGYLMVFLLQREVAVGVDRSTGVPPAPGPMTTVLVLFDARVVRLGVPRHASTLP
jgi:hypothetical protein